MKNLLKWGTILGAEYLGNTFDLSLRDLKGRSNILGLIVIAKSIATRQSRLYFYEVAAFPSVAHNGNIIVFSSRNKKFHKI
jgi:hypothetical protein